MKFQREELSATLLEELSPLFHAHYKEIAHYQDIELDPDLGTYMKVAAAGGLRLFTAREPELGQLVGYAVFFLRHNLHYSQSLQATQDILFLHPSFRKSLRGFTFIRFCDDELRKEKVQVVYHHVKEKHNFGPMLERQGYELVDVIYAKRLDRRVTG